MASLVTVTDPTATPIPQELATFVCAATLQPILAVLTAALDVTFLVGFQRWTRDRLAVLLADSHDQRTLWLSSGTGRVYSRHSLRKRNAPSEQCEQ